MPKTSHPNQTVGPLFTGLSNSDLATLVSRSRLLELRVGDFLFRQGGSVNDLYVLTRGRLKVYVESSAGQSLVLHFVLPGDALGWESLTHVRQHPYTAQAIHDSALLVWPAETVIALAKQYPQFALNWLKTACGRLMDFQQRCRDLAIEPAEQRIARIVLSLSQQIGSPQSEGIVVESPITEKDLAEMAATSPFTVSHVMGQWRREGVVEKKREQLIVRAPDKLEEIAKRSE